MKSFCIPKRNLSKPKKAVSPYQKISPHTEEKTSYPKQNLPMLKKISPYTQKNHPIPRKKDFPILRKNLRLPKISPFKKSPPKEIRAIKKFLTGVVFKNLNKYLKILKIDYNLNL